MKDSVDIRVEFVSYAISDIGAINKLFESEAADKSRCLLAKIKPDIVITRMVSSVDEDKCRVTLNTTTEYMLGRKELVAYFTAIKSRILDALPATHIHQQGRLTVTSRRSDVMGDNGTTRFKIYGVEKPL